MFNKRGDFLLPDFINYPSSEKEILNYWKKFDIFKNIQGERRELNSGYFSFYDGPPFATGLPHYGHILTGTIKDIISRYATQKNMFVERRFGWDCHGLPVEHEIDKKLGIKGAEDVYRMGIANYNNECKKIVQRYTDEWKLTVERSGRWIDFDNDYKTMYPYYMESVWWVFKQLFDKGLVYRGTKVMPFSTACCTPISNFESTQNYKDVTETSIIVALNISGTNEKLLIWTTTPWTLPSNLAVCVNPKLTYVKIRTTNQEVYILSKRRLPFVFKNPKNYVTLDEFCGEKLRDTRYDPLFKYFVELGKRMSAFRVLLDDYVTDETGTGIVHQAPYFGEDDYRICLANGIITKSSEAVCPIDDTGHFTEAVSDLAGMYFKDADPKIIDYLADLGNLFQTSQIKHSYPYCWRSDTPLIYKAVPSWFIHVESITDQLLTNNSHTYWVPEMIKEKRFTNWLQNARDWAVSRNRFWGTPIPIWSSATGDEIICVGSIDELKQLTGNSNIFDIHREFIDDLEVPSRKPGNPPLRRVPEVFDCWFESGSMPYGQHHYPFENKEFFKKIFPADFIAEGIDQTRGWFYTLLVISTQLFQTAPFKNVIVSGLVLAADGSKMSKRKKNYVEPNAIMEQYSADALRLYLINSPLVKGGNLCLKEEGIKNILKTVLLPWYNALRFCILNIQNTDGSMMFHPIKSNEGFSHIMDRWILSYTESLVQFFEAEMQLYRLYTVLPRLIQFIEQLTNWYIRLNRSRIKGDEGEQNSRDSTHVLIHVLTKLAIVMAPFAPFFSEYVYQRLALYYNFEGGEKISVHNHLIPPVNLNLIQCREETVVGRMQTVIDLGRTLRERHTVPLKYPLTELVVVHIDEEYLEDLKRVQNIILKELNIRKIRFTNDRREFGASFKAEPCYKVLGGRYKNDFKVIMRNVKDLTDAEIERGLKDGVLQVQGLQILLDEIQVSFKFNKAVDSRYATISHHDVLVIMDMTKDKDSYEEGTAREIVNRIQKLKKKAKLYPNERILVFYDTEEQALRHVIAKYADFIYHPTQSKLHELNDLKSVNNKGAKIIEEATDIKGLNIAFQLYYEKSLN